MIRLHSSFALPALARRARRRRQAARGRSSSFNALPGPYARPAEPVARIHFSTRGGMVFIAPAITTGSQLVR